MNLPTLTVKPEDRPRFEKAVMSWGALVQCLGWDTLADMYVRRVEPFRDVKPLQGSREKQLKEAKRILLFNCMEDLKEAGMEVKHG